jgi:hypothetical protein
MNQREQVAVDWVTVRYTHLHKNRKGRERGYMGNQWRGEGKGLWSEGPAGSRPGQVRLPAHAGSSLVDFLYPEDGGDTFLWNVG